METMTFDEAKEYINSNPDIWLTPAKTSGYICPLCDNGAGANGTGIDIDPRAKNPNTYHCFKCEFHGDLLQLIQEKDNLDSKKEAFKKACEIYGITLTADNHYSLNGNAIPVKKKAPERAPETAREYTDYTEKLHSMYNADNTHNAYVYLQSRGISQETAQRLGFTYNPAEYYYKGRHTREALIYPATRIDGGKTYQARFLDVPPGEKGTEDKAQWAKDGGSGIFNAEALYQDKQPVFIVEGAIDASSIEELGFKAIAINSTSNTKLIAPAIQSKRTKAKRFILALDNAEIDDAGRLATKKFLINAEKALTNCVFEVNICEGKNYKDANEYLLHDREGLKKVLTETVEKVNTMRDTDEAPEIILDPFENDTTEALAGPFWEWLTKDRAPRIKTGINALDTKINGGLEPSLYVVGGTTGAGKTTLLLNMAYTIVCGGTPVILYSLEMKKEKIIARLMSMYSAIKNPDVAFTEAEIADYNARSKAMQSAIYNLYEELFTKLDKNLIIADYIYSAKDTKEGNNTVRGIKTLTEEFIKATGKRPVVMIDYLQMITNDGFKEYRQAVDDNLTTLLRLKKECDIPVIISSALNREGYDDDGEAPSLHDFKESGRIEYDADVAMIIWEPKDKTGNIKGNKITVVKNRSGQAGKKDGTIDIFYDKAHALICDKDGAQSPPELPY